MHDSGILSFDFMLWHFRSPANTETQALKSSVTLQAVCALNDKQNNSLHYFNTCVNKVSIYSVLSDLRLRLFCTFTQPVK